MCSSFAPITNSNDQSNRANPAIFIVFDFIFLAHKINITYHSANQPIQNMPFYGLLIVLILSPIPFW
ncbi:hypothetical protein BMR02_09340 [Methylococcaceae bacterium HT1]|nr:hypothetical protein BMR02_09340 [Methylococcaceae bacterium HT1]TXL17729.1 hypothetical protein BMR04_04450 [Methylococcaceae bacterium HT3]TXL17733.1 hypothetical protein BMR04_04475 [Methylococcaceae bacterium HT3]TXL22098.1 hypothetical protein BMR03_10285 [Methylococcaceae bacterium HT2]